ncbi:MAG: alpha/beta hydrolase domain-containing protein, partial [Gammaproteobacteria bacterium]
VMDWNRTRTWPETCRHVVLFSACVCGFVGLGLPAQAEVVGIEVSDRCDVLDGQPFGEVGPYEKLTGKIRFEIDPKNPINARIVDLIKAPRDAAGKIRASANFMVLRPKAPCRLSCVALLEVSNRGGKAALAYFNAGRFTDNPVVREDFGDGLLMRRGLTVIWVGWQFDVTGAPHRLRLTVPVATDNGRPIQGLVRADWTVDQLVDRLSLGHHGHLAYAVADLNHPDNVLTVRDGRLAPRRVVPRSDWWFTEARTQIVLRGGFGPGKIYELVYMAKGAALVGLGLAAVRDTLSYAKYNPQSPFRVDYGIAFGVSQSGRFLRHFLYQGFNTDEDGRKVFDGMFIHGAGAGRGSFNHRFAQPSRDAHQYATFFYPTDLFPFTSSLQRDPETGYLDGLYLHQHHANHVPKVIYTNTGYEYWGRAASLIHTSVDGDKDVEPGPSERIYHLASAQHFVGEFPPREHLAKYGAVIYRGNPLDFQVNLRALMIRLIDWVTHDRAPPESRYPRIAGGTLVPVSALDFPAIPGVETPEVVHEAYRVDYGPEWHRGIITLQPPRVLSAFPSLVPQVDAYGNERSGVRNVELEVPLATYTPWSLREGLPEDSWGLMNYVGMTIPFPWTEAKRQQTQDPRPSIESLYVGRIDYLARVKGAARALVAEGFMLPEDVPRVLARSDGYWHWLTLGRRGW